MKAGILSLLLFFLCISNSLFSQTDNSIKITGEILIPDGDFYVVAILSSQDSSIINSAYFDKAGFQIECKTLERFIIKISSPLLYETKSIPVENRDYSSTINIGKIELKPNVVSLDEVQVTATIPKIKLSEGKLLYTIQNNKNLKNLNSLNDILKKLPLVLVENEKINVFGKKNTIILINGIPPKNDNWEFIQPNNIKNIEIITNPTAEYSASGMAVINIITKNSFAEGFNGQISTSVSKGDYWRSNNNIQLGYSTKKINVYSNLNYLPGKRKYVDTYERYFSDGTTMHNNLNQKRTTKVNYNFLLGVDYILNPRHSIGIQFQQTKQKPEKNTENKNDLYLSPNIIHFNTLTNAKSNVNKNIYDLNYSFLIDSLEKKLTVNLGYVDYNSDEHVSIRELTNNSYFKDKKSYSKADLSFYSTNIDYIHKTNKHFTGKLGIYYSHDKNNSFYNLIDENSGILDDDFSNGTIIKENKFAGYLTASKEWKKITLSAGLRFEYVDYKSEDKDGQSHSKTYRDFFPNIDISYSLNDNIQANLSYSRKIYRPKFQDLDPSVIYVDTLTYFMGNTNLVPEYSNSILLNVNYKKFIFFSLGYSQVKDPLFMYVKRQNLSSMICIATTENLNSQNIWTTSLTIPYQYKSWGIQASLGANLNDNKFTINDELEHKKKVMTYIYLNNGLQLPHDIYLSTTYQYNSSGIDGIFFHNERHILSAAINKSFWGDKLSVNIRYDDILKNDKSRTYVDLHDLQFIYGAKYDASYVTLSIKYKFGKTLKRYSVKANSKEELKRLK